MQVLFDILSEHGACYSERFWAKVFERMLLPIFDSVQVEDVDFSTFSNSNSNGADEASRDRWLYETCSHCLHNLISLIVKFYPLVHRQLPKVLLKIQAFMLRTHHSLACVGVDRHGAPDLALRTADVTRDVGTGALGPFSKYVALIARSVSPMFLLQTSCEMVLSCQLIPLMPPSSAWRAGAHM